MQFFIVPNTMQPCLPPHWNSQKRKNLFQSEPENRRKKNKQECNEGLRHIGAVIATQLQQQPSNEVRNFDISSWLESIPFVKLLTDVNTDTKGEHVPLVSRVYEEQYMRQAMNSGETSCVMKSQCECMLLDPKQPFQGVAFPIPSMNASVNGMCLLCLRKTTQMLFYNTIHCGQSVNALIQKYGNICNEPGEYHSSAMLICPPNGPVQSMPLPIVAHQRNKYTVMERGGILWVKQTNVYFEDFT
tara:strand:- start:9627 stop:10358 length:732 start_codon:yes stop_codon:yes gene_type:complete